MVASHWFAICQRDVLAFCWFLPFPCLGKQQLPRHAWQGVGAAQLDAGHIQKVFTCVGYAAKYAPPAAVFAPFLEVVENTLPLIFIPDELPHKEHPPLATRFQTV